MPFDPSQGISDLYRATDAIGSLSQPLVGLIRPAVADDMHRANDVRCSLQAVVDFADARGCSVRSARDAARAAVNLLNGDARFSRNSTASSAASTGSFLATSLVSASAFLMFWIGVSDF